VDINQPAMPAESVANDPKATNRDARSDPGLDQKVEATGPESDDMVRSHWHGWLMALGLKVTEVNCRDEDEITHAISAAASTPGAGLVVLPTPFLAVKRDLVFRLAATYRIPAIYPFRYFARSGGLMSYGIDTLDIYRRAASYVDQILKGAKPANLPVQAPIKFELVINLDVAKAMHLSVSSTLLARADEVIG
jgi:putative ABC transport system substrate-binding protein